MKERVLILSAVLLFTALFSCEDPTSIGETVIPEDDDLQVDSITFTDFVMNTIADDTLYTSGRTTSFVGEDVSDTFGTSTANFYTELRYLDSVDMVNPIVDSARIFFQVTGFEGDEQAEQSLELFTLMEEISFPNLVDTGFVTDQKIAEFTMKSFANLDTLISGETAPIHLQADLDPTFSQTLVNEFSNGNITSTTELNDYVKGFALKPLGDGTGKGVFTIDVSSSSISGITIFYQNDDNETVTLPIGLLPINTGTDSTSVYNHNQLMTDYSTGSNNIETQLANYNSTGYDMGYVQGGNGVFTEIDFTNLQAQIDSSFIINRAEIRITPQFESIADTINYPSSITLFEEFAINDEGEKNGGMIDIAGNGLTALLPGRLYDQQSTSFLNLDEETGEYFYRFFLPNYLQGVIEEELEPKLIIGISNRGGSFNGFQFSKNTDIEFRVSYSITN